jgi:hypothetical protein
MRSATQAAPSGGLNYGDDQFMEVLDDGKGIDAEVVRNGRTGHWGLTGLFERAARIGGQIAIEPRAGGGTRDADCACGARLCRPGALEALYTALA